MRTESMHRNGFTVMMRLIGLIKPLMLFMILAVTLGVIGNLTAIFIPVLGSVGLLNAAGYKVLFPVSHVIVAMIVCAVLRGFLRYGEQACNHFIAFKLLAIIRHKVFEKLRSLAPAKLEGKEKGNLISVITSDIELLEVFYAHTISPIIIAVITSGIMTYIMWGLHPILGMIAICGYLTIGVVIPLARYKKGDMLGQGYRDDFGKMNSYYLDSLRGLTEVIQFGMGKNRLENIQNQTEEMEKTNEQLKAIEGRNKAVTDTAVLTIASLMLFTGALLWNVGSITVVEVVLAFTMMISSFGPVIALSSLSNNLYHTLACGNRVLDLLEEEPQVEDVTGQDKTFVNEGVEVTCEHVTFAYEKEVILKDISLTFPKGKIIGIHGKSGSGKSTLLKLMMRFWKVNEGSIAINERDLETINTEELRQVESLVTQDTCLFHDSIAANIRIAKADASMEEVIEAAKKASIHELIVSLPNGYDTNVGELGNHLSGGEKQRIGVARAFLHDSSLILLDEPTSNLDSLNEGIILKALEEEAQNKTVVLVSHRKSTMGIADMVYSVEQGRAS